MPFPTLSARDMCEERADLVTWLEDDGKYGGPASWSMGLDPFEAKHERRSASRWSTSLRAASLTYTSTSLTRTALAAGAAFDDYALTAEDIPQPHGFIAWEEPVTANATDLHSLSGMAITAATWAVYGAGVEIRWWTDKNQWIKDWSGGNPDMGVPKLTPQQLRETHRLHPTRMVAVGNSTLWFGEKDAWPVGRIPRPPGLTLAEAKEYRFSERRLAEAERALVASWLLMGQTLTVSTEVHTPRASMARIGRLDPRLLGVVRQVTLRHKSIAPDRHGNVEGPRREWAHRWVVTGHWRKKRKDARPGTPSKIWITDFFKGPEGAPLLDPSKLVNVLRR